MTKKLIPWEKQYRLLDCPPSDLNWENARKRASVNDLKYVLRIWGSRGITGKKKIEAEIRIRKRKLKKLGIGFELF